MNARTSLSILLSVMLFAVAAPAQALAENTATNPIPADGAFVGAEVFEESLYLLLDFSPSLGAVSHTGYFSDDYSDAAARDPAHCLGSPPFPEIFPTGFLVGWDDPGIPEFARASLEECRTYYWCVDEFDGQTTWPGDVWTFTVMPKKAWNPNPPDGARGVAPDPNVTLTWERGNVETTRYEIRYRIYYGTDRDAVRTAATPNADITANSYEISGLAPATDYFWRIDTVQRKISPPFVFIITTGDVWTFQTSQRIIYVDDDATGANDGSSWENAYRYLQDALADANASPKPLEIHVAQGTYRPDEDTLHPDGTGDRTAAFQLINGVTLKGAYAGLGAPEPNDRNIDLYETMLSGDLNGDDGPDFANRNDNSSHVFYHPQGLNLDNTAVLDGFIISAGDSSQGLNLYRLGGGMYNYQSSPTVSNCTFTANYAYSAGGGMYNYRNSPTVNNCTFKGNRTLGDGAGMSNMYGTPTVDRCTFTANYAGYDGGAMDNSVSSPTLRNSTFINNLAARYGGGICNVYDSSPTVTNCTFTANTTVYYGGHGGGVYNSVRSNPMVEVCTFSRNSAEAGGGMCNWYNSNPTVRNCTFADNNAPKGRAMACDSERKLHPSTVTIVSSIIWNGSDWLWNNDNSTIKITYSDVQGSWPGSGNIDTNPSFVYDLHLGPDSPCINAGDPNYVAGPNDVDMDGENRVMLGRLDMGADEFNPFAAEFVVVRKQRVGRTVFQYECQIVLQNISRFAVSGISLEMAKWSGNMTIIEPNVTFGDTEVGAGESITSVDTCTFTVDRSEPIDQAEIIWRVTAELVDTGEKMEHTVSTTVPPDPQAGFDGLKDLIDKWLWQGTAGGIDADSVADGTVNLADFAKLADGWIER